MIRPITPLFQSTNSVVLIFSLILLIGAATALKFHQAGFSDYQANNLMILSNSSSGASDKHSVVSGSTLWLLPLPKSSWKQVNGTGFDNLYGRIEYKDGIPFIDNASNKTLSFNTSFTFQLITSAGFEEKCGGGMSFFMSDIRLPISPEMKYFTVPNSPPFLVVEFDTFKTTDNITTNDPSGSHVGIDINSFISNPFLDTSPTTTNKSAYPELYFYKNYTFTSWVSYNAFSQMTNVWMTNDSAKFSEYLDPPLNLLEPILTRKYDLRSLFDVQNSMYVGLSAGTDNDFCMLSCAVYSWYLSVESVMSNSTNETGITAMSSSTSETGITAMSNSNRQQYIRIVIPVAIVGLLLIIGMVLFFCCPSKMKSRILGRSTSLSKSTKELTGFTQEALDGLPRYSYKNLRSLTNNFTSLIGEGGFSRVYKATLPDGSIMAIKRLKDGVRKEAEFSSEIQIISSIRHRNLLQLEGWSYDNGQALLVYKFMVNGSLEKYLFGEKKGTLDSHTRLKILSGVASALEYLHFDLGKCILHRDVKAANVLLTEDFEPVLGDFGLARFIKHNQCVTATIVGTPGYVAPEVVMMRKVTDKADVYSFGVLALEVACGCKALWGDAINPDDAEQQVVYLVERASTLRGSGRLMDVLDPSITQLIASEGEDTVYVSLVQDQWKALLELALMCCLHAPESRPDMRQVNQGIHKIISLLDPSQEIAANFGGSHGYRASNVSLMLSASSSSSDQIASLSQSLSNSIFSPR